MVIKRKKIGSVTTTINTRTGKQTMSTSQKIGNVRITHTTSNDGTRRRTTTTGYGDGWFDKTSTNLNKKQPKRKKGKSFLGKLFSNGELRTTTRVKKSAKTSYQEVEEKKPFYEEKNPEDFTPMEWFMYLGILFGTLTVIVAIVKRLFF